VSVEDKIPDNFRKNAYHPSQFVYAFRKKDLEKLFEEIMKSNIAINSGEVWIIDQDDRQSLVPLESGRVEVFSWKINPQDQEQWYDFVERSCKESLNLINSWNLEKNVRLDLLDKVWYNFEFVEE
jgi:hypothetical protein